MAVMTPRDPLGRAALRTVLIVVAVALALYLIYLLQRPLTWLVIAAFIAVAMSGPVNLLARHMKRGLAIALAYLALVMIPIGLGALLIPSLVGQIENLADNVPEYAQDVTDFVNENETLNDLNDKYDFTCELQSAADDLPSKIGDAAGRASGHRRRRRQLDLRHGHDPDPEHLHGRRGRPLGGGVRARAAARPRRAGRAGAARRRQRDRQLRRRGADPGDPRRGDRVHRADHPRRAVRRARWR